MSRSRPVRIFSRARGWVVVIALAAIFGVTAVALAMSPGHVTDLSLGLSSSYAEHPSTTYTIGFSTSSSGALSSGQGIVIQLAGGGVPSGLDHVEFWDAGSGTTQTAGASVSGNVVTVAVPSAIATATALRVQIDGVTNPNAGSYGCSVHTTTDSGVASTSYAISKIRVTGYFTAENKVYDGGVDATILSTGLYGVNEGDDVQLTGVAMFDTKDAGVGKNVWMSSTSLQGADAGNYTLTSVETTTADIDKQDLTVSGIVVSDKVYDGSDAADVDFSGATLNGVVGYEDVTLDSSGCSATFDGAGVGTHSVSLSGLALTGAAAGNYSLVTPDELRASITPAELSVSGAVAQDKTYDGSDSATVDFSGATLTGVAGSDDVTLDSSEYSASFDTKDVGTGKPITVSGLALSGSDAGNYTLDELDGLSADITARDLTVSATADDKTYDGGSDASVELSTDALGTDDVEPSYTAATFDTKDAGDGKTVTVSGIGISGADAGDYNLLSTTATTTADVSPLEISIDHAWALDKTYDATDSAAVSFVGATLNGVLEGDDVSLDPSSYTATFDTKDVGDDKPVTVSGVALSGADAGNYTLDQPEGLTASVFPREIGVVGAVAQNKTYDGEPSAMVDFSSAEATGVLPGDDVSLDTSDYCAGFSDFNVGNGIPVTVEDVTLSGNDAGDYTLDQPTGLSADITPAEISIVDAVAQDKTYDGTSTASVDFSQAWLDGESYWDVFFSDLWIDTSGYSAGFNDKTVADGKPVAVTGVTLAGPSAGNYTLDQPTGLSADVTPAELSVDGAVAQDKTYDGTSTASVDFSGAHLAGVIGTDDVHPDWSGYSASFDSQSAGDGKPVYVSGMSLSGDDAGNYTLDQPDVLSADITAKDVTGSFRALNKMYDGTTDAETTGRTLVGLIPGDDVSLDGAAAFDTKDVGNGKTVTIDSPTLGGGQSGDYVLDSVDTTTADITAKHVGGSFGASDKVYDGTTLATTSGRTLFGVLDGDDVSLAGTATFDTKDVGTDKTVTIETPTLSGGDAGDYTLDSVGTTTAAITAAHVTGSFSASDKVYDGTKLATTSDRTLFGVLDGDDVSLAGTATFDTKDVGTDKTVTIETPTLSGGDAGDYTLDSVDTTTAAITAAHVTGSFGASDKVYDGTRLATTSDRTVVGAVEGDDVSLAGTATFDTKDVGTDKTVTIETPTLSGNDAGDYTLDSVGTTTAAITAKALTLGGASAVSKVYNGNPGATIDFTDAHLVGVVESEDVGFDKSGYTASFADKAVGTTRTVTVGGIVLTGTDSGNYTLTQPTGLTADITPVNLTISGAAAVGKVYDRTTNATLDLSGAHLDGVVGGDSVAIDQSHASGTFDTKDVGSGKTVTVTGITLSGTDAGDYRVTQPGPLSADVTPKDLTISGAVAQDKPYDGTTSATVAFSEASLVGVVSGDSVSIDASGYTATFGTKDVGTDKAVTVTGVGLSGADAGDYTLSQPSGLTASITDSPPVARADSGAVVSGGTLTVAAPGVLGNDTDTEGDGFTASLVGDVSHGALTLDADGGYTYTPAAGFSGVDSFSYHAYDGSAYSNTATVTITVSPADPSAVTFGIVSTTKTRVHWTNNAGSTGCRVYLGSTLLYSLSSAHASDTCTVSQFFGPKSQVYVLDVGGNGTTSSKVRAVYSPTTAVTLGTVNFTGDSSALSSTAKSKLNTFASLIASKGFTAVTVYGYAAQSGTTAYRLKISAARAAAVKSYLASRFKALKVSVTITAVARGSADPVGPPLSDANRRVDVIVR